MARWDVFILLLANPYHGGDAFEFIDEYCENTDWGVCLARMKEQNYKQRNNLLLPSKIHNTSLLVALISVSVKFQKFFDANLSVTIQIGLFYDFIDLFL